MTTVLRRPKLRGVIRLQISNYKQTFSVFHCGATMKTTVGTAMTTMAKKTKAAMITGLLVILKGANKKMLLHVSSCGIL